MRVFSLYSSKQVKLSFLSHSLDINMGSLKKPLTLLCFLILTACTASAEESRSISVVGNGAVTITPDIATLQLGVETEAATAQAAMAENAEKTNSLINALRQQGVSIEQISTEAINLHPRYEYPRKANNTQQRILTGYTGTNLVRVHITELDKAGQIMDAAIDAGGNRIDSITFDLSDPSEALAQARKAAWENALAQAQQMAALANAELGPVITIEIHQNPGVRMARMEARSLQSDTPVMGGQKQINAGVSVRWQLR